MEPKSELTVRAVVSGLLVGCLIGASNVTIGLKIGWTFGASITAAVLSFAIWRALAPAARPYSAKENLISATAGSSAGTMASAGGFVAAIPALEMIRANAGQEPLGFVALSIWAISVAFLGVHFAVPLRRQMVVVDRLKYPTGTAAGETIRAMYASGVEAVKKAKVLLYCGVFAALFKLLFLIKPLGLEPFENLSFDDIGMFGVAILGISVYSLQLGINLSPMMLGAGVLIGPKVGWSLLGGSLLAWAVLTPILLHNGTVEVMPDLGAVNAALADVDAAGGGASRAMTARLERAEHEAIRCAERIAGIREGVTAIDVLRHYKAPAALLVAAGAAPEADLGPVPELSRPPETTSPYRAGFNWVLWTGVSLMITSSFVSLGMQWRSVVNTFRSLRAAATGTKAAPDPDAEEDAPDPYPMKYWAIGMTLATILTVVLAQRYFQIPIWEGVLAVALSFVIAAIAVRATGETDINPVGAMGKITQVVYGALAPGKMQINLMAAAITSAGASQAGDLMHDLKAGYMLKSSIRRQVITQLIGVVVGVFAAAGTFRLLSSVYEIPGDEFPGPAVFAWYKMAEVLAVGLGALPKGALWGALAGAAFGVLIPILAKTSPKIGRWLPSPVAFGIAFMVPAVYSISMWFGALLTSQYNRHHPQRVERYGASLASGFIAGEGLMMVVFALYLMARQFM